MAKNSITAHIAARERLVQRALRSAKTLIAAAAKAGIDAPKRRYRRRKKKGGKTHIAEAMKAEKSSSKKSKKKSAE